MEDCFKIYFSRYQCSLLEDAKDLDGDGVNEIVRKIARVGRTWN